MKRFAALGFVLVALLALASVSFIRGQQTAQTKQDELLGMQSEYAVLMAQESPTAETLARAGVLRNQLILRVMQEANGNQDALTAALVGIANATDPFLLPIEDQPQLGQIDDDTFYHDWAASVGFLQGWYSYDGFSASSCASNTHGSPGLSHPNVTCASSGTLCHAAVYGYSKLADNNVHNVRIDYYKPCDGTPVITYLPNGHIQAVFCEMHMEILDN